MARRFVSTRKPRKEILHIAIKIMEDFVAEYGSEMNYLE
jgi:hypothetical protein